MPRFSFQFMCHVATCPDSCKLHMNCFRFLTQNCPVVPHDAVYFLEWMGAQLVEPFRGHEISGRIVLRPGLCLGLRYVVPNCSKWWFPWLAVYWNCLGINVAGT